MTSDHSVQLSRIAVDMLHDLAELSAIHPEFQRHEAMQIIFDAFQDAYRVMREGEDDDGYWTLLLSENLHEV